MKRDAAFWQHQAEKLAEALAVFLGHDERFQPMIGGNPQAVDAMLDNAREALAAYALALIDQ